MTSQALISKIHCTILGNQKKIVRSMFNNKDNLASAVNRTNLFIAGNSTSTGVEEDMSADSCQQPQLHNTPSAAYEKLDDEEKEKARTIVYLMDHFSISLDGYHELAQVEKSLPRVHLVESCSKFMDSQWDVKRTPGTSPGAELPLKLLLEKEIQQHVSTVYIHKAGVKTSLTRYIYGV